MVLKRITVLYSAPRHHSVLYGLQYMSKANIVLRTFYMTLKVTRIFLLFVIRKIVMNILAIIKSRLKGVLQARKTEKAITKVCVVSSVTETGTFEAAPGGISLDLEGGSNSDWLKQTFLFCWNW